MLPGVGAAAPTAPPIAPASTRRFGGGRGFRGDRGGGWGGIHDADAPYGALSRYPYAWDYAVPTIYTVNCGGIDQPICATPTQMWSQSYANTEAAGNAIMAASLGAN